MQFLPISLNITDKRILIVGGGKVALRKSRILWMKSFWN
jgi:siroheme synthase (precorrin-2 oxidase/ferrochelatase)